MSDLFTPIEIGAITLPNRIVMAPLTRCRIGADGVPQAMNAEYYSQRASAGLIISEACAISPQGTGYAYTPGIHSMEQIEGWSRVTAAVHAAGGRIILQLWHVGRISHPSLQPNGQPPVAPSAIRPAGEAFTYEGLQAFPTPRALETGEISDIIADYGQAARNALQADFDGVEIHAANGYLIDQFLRDGTNHRQDRYGGPPEHRIRLLMEVIEAVTAVWGAARTGVRLSPVNSFNDISDSDPEALFSTTIEHLNPVGLAYVHVVEGVIHSTLDSAGLFDFERLSARCQSPYVANNGYDRARATAAIAHGHAELVAFGIPFIANPDLPRRFAQDLSLNEPDPDTFYAGGARGYTDYPPLQEV